MPQGAKFPAPLHHASPAGPSNPVVFVVPIFENCRLSVCYLVMHVFHNEVWDRTTPVCVWRLPIYTYVE
eukprot:5452379-Pyramimonas_sp.AAC.1